MDKRDLAIETGLIRCPNDPRHVLGSHFAGLQIQIHEGRKTVGRFLTIQCEHPGCGGIWQSDDVPAVLKLLTALRDSASPTVQALREAITPLLATPVAA